MDFGSLFVLLQNVFKEKVESDIDLESFVAKEPEGKPLQWTSGEEISESHLCSNFNGVVNQNSDLLCFVVLFGTSCAHHHSADAVVCELNQLCPQVH